MVFEGGEQALFGGAEGASHADACGEGVTTAAEEGGKFGGVEDFRVFGAQRDANFPVVEFFEIDGDFDVFHGADHVDGAFAVVGGELEGLLDVLGEIPAEDASAAVGFERIEQGAHHQQAAVGVVLVNRLVNRADVDATANKVGHDFVGAQRGGWVAERVGVGGDGGVDGVARNFVDRPVEGGEPFVDDLSSGGAGGVDQIHVAVAGVAFVVIDDDEFFRVRNRVEAFGAEALVVGGVEGEHDVEIFQGLLGRKREPVAGGEKGEAFLHSVLVPHPHVFAEGAERGGERELGADGVAVGADVAKEDEALVVFDDRAQFGKGGVGWGIHGVGCSGKAAGNPA